MRELLTDAIDMEIESLALDYVEQVLGRKYFQEHWARQPLPQHRKSVEDWLTYLKLDTGMTDSIVNEIESLYRDGSKWVH